MKGFVAFFLLLTVLVLAWTVDAQSPQWKLYDMTQMGLDKMYYDEAGVIRQSPQVLKVPTRILHSPQSVKGYTEKSDVQYRDLRETQSLMEIDCESRKWRAVTGMNIDSKGEVIDRAERVTEWEAVIAESTMESLLKQVCPQKAEGGKAVSVPPAFEPGTRDP